MDGDLSYVVVSQRVRRLTGLVVMSAGLRIDAAKQNDELHPHNTGA
jgi:hypothetical protein